MIVARIIVDPEAELGFRIDIRRLMEKYPIVSIMMKYKRDGVAMPNGLRSRLKRLRKKMSPEDRGLLHDLPVLIQVIDFF